MTAMDNIIIMIICPNVTTPLHWSIHLAPICPLHRTHDGFTHNQGSPPDMPEAPVLYAPVNSTTHPP